MKKIKIDMTVFDMIEMYPETKGLLVKVGLDGVANPLMLRTVGKKMTVKKGAKTKKIPWQDVVSLFEEHDFVFIEEEYNE